MFSQTCAYLLLVSVHLVINNGEDYWSDDFDEDKNCEQEELIAKLQKETSPSKCSSRMAGSFEVQWSECKKDLAKKLSNICGLLDIEETGDFLYCKDRGKTSCCFHNESCAEKYDEVVHDKMTNGAISFLQNTTAFLEEMVAIQKYDTCHAILGYDASVCAKDCTELENSTFAKNCSDSGGMFKCCIRRDKEFCHECRFCCTLSMCTTIDGTFYKGSENLGDEHIKHEDNAQIGFEIDRKMWKSGDFRCLKPKEILEPENWPHYEMKGFRSASTKDQLNNVMEIKFDIFFFNFEDPKIFKEMMKGRKRKSLWKKTYGFDYVSFNDEEGIGSKVGNSKCIINCFKAENRKFAKRCRKEGGFFKCCMTAMGTQPWHKLRHTLANMKLITKTEQLCVKNGSKDTCQVCSITQICSKYNTMTGQVEDTFKTPYTTNPQHRIGATDGFGLKYWVCFTLQTCKTDPGVETIPALSTFWFVQQDFRQAANRNQFCNLTQVASTTMDLRNETFQEAFYKECMKQKSNVFICPDTKEFKQNKTTEIVTKVLKSVRKKLEKKKKIQKKKKKKVKKKKKKKKISIGPKKSGKNKNKKRIKGKQKKKIRKESRKKVENEKEEIKARKTVVTVREIVVLYTGAHILFKCRD